MFVAALHVDDVTSAPCSSPMWSSSVPALKPCDIVMDNFGDTSVRQCAPQSKGAGTTLC